MIAAVTFGVFMTEALVHYNTGISAANGGPWKFNIPNTNELIKLGAIVGVATLATSLIIGYLRK
jgi:hypothetical protein